MGILFLEGPSGLGKTTLLLQGAHASGKVGCGYITQRVVDGQGQTKGFRLSPFQQVRQSVVVELGESHNLFIRMTPNGCVRDLRCFEQVATMSNPHADFIVLDEVGGVELSLPAYVAWLYEILDSGVPCIGVLKSEDNFAHMNHSMPQTQLVKTTYMALRQAVVNRYDGAILRLDDRTREQVEQAVTAFFGE